MNDVLGVKCAALCRSYAALFGIYAALCRVSSHKSV